MGKEEILFESEERRDLASVAGFMRAVADRIESGEVVLQRGDDELRLALPSDVTLEIKVERETEGSGTELSLEIELEWPENQPSEPTTTVA